MYETCGPVGNDEIPEFYEELAEMDEDAPEE
jgi:hypothetical protein